MAKPKCLLWAVCFFAVTFVLASRPAFGVTKEETLKKFEEVMVDSNQMNLYGYDLKPVAFKLEQVSELLLSNRFEAAHDLLGEIHTDLDAIRDEGPAYINRERQLIELQILADVIQQLVIFTGAAWLLLRFSFIQTLVRKYKPGFWEVNGYSNSADPWNEERFWWGDHSMRPPSLWRI